MKNKENSCKCDDKASSRQVGWSDLSGLLKIGVLMGIIQFLVLIFYFVLIFIVGALALSGGFR